jgi:hypothetical protein
MGWRKKKKSPVVYDSPERQKNGRRRRQYLLNRVAEADLGKTRRYRIGNGIERIE